MTQPNPPHPNRGPDRFGKFGMGAVGFSAAVLSFQTWVLLAQAVGFTAHWSLRVPPGFGPAVGFGFTMWISWLYPIAVDWYSVVVTRVWLRARRGSRVAEWAKWNSIGAIALAFGGQAVFHAMTALHWKISQAWPFVVVMGGIPPVLVGLVVHLYHELANERAEQRTQQQPAAAAEPNPVPVPEPAPLPSPEPRPAPVLEPPAVRQPNPPTRRTEPGRPAKAEPVATVTPIDRRTEEQIAREVRDFVAAHRTRTGKVPGRHLVQSTVRVAYGRTRDLIDRAVAELDQAEPDGADDEERQPDRELIGVG